MSLQYFTRKVGSSVVGRGGVASAGCGVRFGVLVVVLAVCALSGVFSIQAGAQVPSAPTSVRLLPAHDTGKSDSDGITNRASGQTFTFVVEGSFNVGDTIRLIIGDDNDNTDDSPYLKVVAAGETSSVNIDVVENFIGFENLDTWYANAQREVSGGNRSALSPGFDFGVERTPPSLTVTQSGNGAISTNRTFTIEASDPTGLGNYEGSGLDKVEKYDNVNSCDASTTGTPTTLTLTNGSVDVTVQANEMDCFKATDIAGNVRFAGTPVVEEESDADPVINIIKVSGGDDTTERVYTATTTLTGTLEFFYVVTDIPAENCVNSDLSRLEIDGPNRSTYIAGTNHTAAPNTHSCFAAQDESGRILAHTTAAVSGTTAPVIDIRTSSTSGAKTFVVEVENIDGLTDFAYADSVSKANCNSSATFISYLPKTVFESRYVQSGTHDCFRATNGVGTTYASTEDAIVVGNTTTDITNGTYFGGGFPDNENGGAIPNNGIRVVGSDTIDIGAVMVPNNPVRLFVRKKGAAWPAAADAVTGTVSSVGWANLSYTPTAGEGEYEFAYQVRLDDGSTYAPALNTLTPLRSFILDQTPPVITITKVSGGDDTTERVFSAVATDANGIPSNEGYSASSVPFRYYANISSASDCVRNQIDGALTSPIAYTAGTEITVPANQHLCFLAEDYTGLRSRRTLAHTTAAVETPTTTPSNPDTTAPVIDIRASSASGIRAIAVEVKNIDGLTDFASAGGVSKANCNSSATFVSYTPRTVFFVGIEESGGECFRATNAAGTTYASTEDAIVLGNTTTDITNGTYFGGASVINNTASPYSNNGVQIVGTDTILISVAMVPSNPVRLFVRKKGAAWPAVTDALTETAATHGRVDFEYTPTAGEGEYEIAYQVRLDDGSTYAPARNTLTPLASFIFDQTSPTITITKVSGGDDTTERVFSAVATDANGIPSNEGFADSGAPFIVYSNISSASDCDLEEFDEALTSPTPYTAGTELTVPANQHLCFLARDYTRILEQGTFAHTTAVVSDTTNPSIVGTPTLRSNNSTTTVAKAGDTITLFFVVSEELGSDPSATIAGETATVVKTVGSDTEYTATYQVTSSTTNGQAAYDIGTLTDLASNTFDPIAVTLTGSAGVVVDRTAPVITFGAFVVVSAVTATYSVTVTDAGTVTTQYLDNATSCTASTTGSFQNFTGTSHAFPLGTQTCFKATDAAGNVGYAITPEPYTIALIAAHDTGSSSTDGITNRALNSTFTFQVTGSFTVDEQVRFYDDGSFLQTKTIVSGEESGFQFTISDLASASDRSATFEGTFVFSSDASNTGTIYRFTVDRTAPVITVADGTASNTFTARATDTNGSGVATYGVADSVTESNCTVANIGNTSFSAYTSGGDHPVSSGTASCFRVFDTAGNVAYKSTAQALAADSTPPVITLGSFSLSGVTMASYPVTVTDTSTVTTQYLDNATSCDASTSGSFQNFTGTSHTFPLGTQTCFKATDAQGNVGYAITPEPYTIALIAAHDTGSSSTDGITNRALNSAFTFQVTGSFTVDEQVRFFDDGSFLQTKTIVSGEESGFQFTISNFASAFSISATREGRFTAFSSNSSNTGTTYTLTFDRTAPVVTVADGTASNTFTATATDTGGSGVATYGVADSVSESNCTAANIGNTSFNAYTSGDDHPVSSGTASCFRVTDIAGNTTYVSTSAVSDPADPPVSPPSSTDTTAPTFDLSYAGSPNVVNNIGYYNTTTLTTGGVTVSNIVEENLATATLTLARTDTTGVIDITPASAIHSVTGAVSFANATSVPNGTYTATVVLTDDAGNTTTKTLNLVVDNTAPTITGITIPDPSARSSVRATVTVRHDQTFSETLTATLAGQNCSSLNRITLTGSGTSTTNIQLRGRTGTFACTITLTDQAGNTSTSFTIPSFTIERGSSVGGGGVRFGGYVRVPTFQASAPFVAPTQPTPQPPVPADRQERIALLKSALNRILERIQYLIAQKTNG